MLAGAVALALSAAAGPAAAGPFDVIKSLPVPGAGLIPGANKPTPTPAPNTTGASGGAAGAAGGPMMMQAGAPQAPLHKLGTDAVAVVENATPGAPVQMMDYVFAKQSIKLPPKGKITLSYLNGCLSETFTGGTITVGMKESTVAGGVRTNAARPGCKPATPIVLASASEAGATVNRITPFSNAHWDERALHSGPPVFKWEVSAGAVTQVRVKDMDKPGEPVVWQGPVTRNWVIYPATAAKLAPGMPYKAEALAGDSVVASALFSIDPALDEGDSLAARVVPLAPPA
jgi:hypothetical protein